MAVPVISTLEGAIPLRPPYTLLRDCCKSKWHALVPSFINNHKRHANCLDRFRRETIMIELLIIRWRRIDFLVNNVY